MKTPGHSPAEVGDAESDCGGSFWSTLAAPWHLLHPQRAARNMVSGSRAGFCVSFGLCVLLLAVVIIGLVMWDEAVRGYRLFPGGDDWAQPGFAEVWRKWHAWSWFGPAETMLVCVLFLTPLAGAVAAWLLLPNVHQAGSGWRSYRRSCRAVGAGAGLLVILAVVIGFPIAAVSNWVDVGGNPGPELGIPFVVFCAACGCALVYWLNLATRAVRGPETALPELPPRCEGCGYDLTHQGAEGRCTECGLSLAESLTPVRRSGNPWQYEQHPLTWATTTVSIIFRPSDFYRRLRVRASAEAADRFARWQYAAIGIYAGCACALAIFLLTLRFSSSPPGFVCFFPCVFVFLVPLICWFVHRFVGAAAASWFIVSNALPDPRCARQVMDYESAYLWSFCTYSSTLLFSFVMFEQWMSEFAESLGVYSIGGMPIEPAAVFFGNIVLGLLWFRRYHIACINIRWSNF